MTTLATNKKAKFEYQILETYEAGIVLAGHEVKSIKKGYLSLKGAYVHIHNEQAWLINAHISPYQIKNITEEYEPTRKRRLLLHKKEIRTLIGQTKQKGLTLVPIRVYTKQNKIKLEFGLGQGKHKFDKRNSIKDRESKRRIQKALHQRRG